MHGSPNKRAALLGAFCSRFAPGFFAATVRLPWSPVVTGIVVGVLTSLPDAIITKEYAPIMVTGVGRDEGRQAATVTCDDGPRAARILRADLHRPPVPLRRGR